MAARLPLRIDADGITKQWWEILNSEIGRREVVPLGWRVDAGSLFLRFRAPLTIVFVQVHVQSGSGVYDPGTSEVSEEIDCREDRLQDVEVPDLDPGTYTVFYIPIEYTALEERIPFDGQDERPDEMSFVMVEV